MTIKKWQIRGNDEKEELCIRKMEIQKILKMNSLKLALYLALNVDKPKPGFEYINDGIKTKIFCF